MTTIAYDPKDKAIYYDSQMTAGEFVVDMDCNKRANYKHLVAIGAGQDQGIPDLIKAYLTKEPTTCSFDSSCLLYDKKIGRLYQVCVYQDGEQTAPFEVFIEEIDLTKPYAIGSGYKFAIGALDAGASGKDAIKIASKRDVNTGGKVRCFKLS